MYTSSQYLARVECPYQPNMPHTQPLLSYKYLMVILVSFTRLGEEAIS